jgi:hypothetical protein
MFADPKGAPPEATPDKVRPESLPPPPPPHETTKNAIKIINNDFNVSIIFNPIFDKLSQYTPFLVF